MIVKFVSIVSLATYNSLLRGMNDTEDQKTWKVAKVYIYIYNIISTDIYRVLLLKWKNHHLLNQILVNIISHLCYQFDSGLLLL